MIRGDIWRGKEKKTVHLLIPIIMGRKSLYGLFVMVLQSQLGDMGAADIAVIQNTDLKKLYFGRLIRKGMRTI